MNRIPGYYIKDDEVIICIFLTSSVIEEVTFNVPVYYLLLVFLPRGYSQIFNICISFVFASPFFNAVTNSSTKAHLFPNLAKLKFTCRSLIIQRNIALKRDPSSPHLFPSYLRGYMLLAFSNAGVWVNDAPARLLAQALNHHTWAMMI